MSSTLEVAPSTIVCRLAAGDVKDASVAEVRTLLTLDDAGVKAAYEANTDTNAFTDAEESQLAGIEPLADVTDEANVTTALDGATPGVVTPETADSLFLQDNSAADALKLATVASIIALVPASSNNIFYNGNFNIWQRGATFTAAVDEYTADRWAWRDVGAGVVDILRSTDVPNGFSEFSLQVDVTTADASLAATDFYGLEYRVEGLDTIPLAFGSADALTTTVSFWVKSAKTGIHSVAFQNSAIDRSYVAEYTVSVADTWEKKSVTIAGDTSGTWLKDNGIGLAVIFACAAGSNFTGTAGAWAGADDKASTNQVNVMDNAANNFLISQAQLEVGTLAGAFAVRPFTQELALCKRYFQKTFPYATAPASSAGAENALQYQVVFAGASKNYKVYWQLPVQLRIEPVTQTYYNPDAAGDRFYNASGAANSGTSAAQGITNDRQIAISNGQAAADALEDICYIHATVESEL